MSEKNRSLSDTTDGTRQRPSVRPSFWAITEDVRQQIGYRSIAHSVAFRPFVDEIARIIAEVYLYHPDASIKIGDEYLSAELVQEIYRELTRDHIVAVINNYAGVSTVIRCPKQYLRTSLYNVVFEKAFKEQNTEKNETADL